MAAAHHARNRKREPTLALSNPIEYIKDLIYLVSVAPDSVKAMPVTHFPDLETGAGSGYYDSRRPPSTVYISPRDCGIEYRSFHADFGPLHIGHLYHFANRFKQLLGLIHPDKTRIILWCESDPKARTNLACLLACFMVLVEKWKPPQALAPLMQMDPPAMPFRDAGYGEADYGLSVQDVVYGVYKAHLAGICSLQGFDLQEYELYEKVEYGDLNWISPELIAFASPEFRGIVPINLAVSRKPRHWSRLEYVLRHFTTHNVGLVVRLNSELYHPVHFTENCIQHIDMIFDDGSNPSLQDVRKFINTVHRVITVQKKVVAVHCKAGLGRTGCLIGAYLIYRYGFTANETIAFMRFMRPGMVVGPQQHWLDEKQGTFREWSFQDKAHTVEQASTPRRLPDRRDFQAHTPTRNQKRIALGEVSANDQSGCSVSDADALDASPPPPTPGQPRKTGKMYASASKPYRRPDREAYHILAGARPGAAPASSILLSEASEAEEDDAQLRVFTKRVAPPSPGSSAAGSRGNDIKRRAVSCTMTTISTTAMTQTSTCTWTNGPSDNENREPAPTVPPAAKSNTKKLSVANAGKAKSAASARRVPESKAASRKTSNRLVGLAKTEMAKA